MNINDKINYFSGLWPSTVPKNDTHCLRRLTKTLCINVIAKDTQCTKLAL